MATSGIRRRDGGVPVHGTTAHRGRAVRVPSGRREQHWSRGVRRIVADRYSEESVRYVEYSQEHLDNLQCLVTYRTNLMFQSIYTLVI